MQIKQRCSLAGKLFPHNVFYRAYISLCHVFSDTLQISFLNVAPMRKFLFCIKNNSMIKLPILKINKMMKFIDEDNVKIVGTNKIVYITAIIGAVDIEELEGFVAQNELLYA